MVPELEQTNKKHKINSKQQLYCFLFYGFVKFVLCVQPCFLLRCCLFFQVCYLFMLCLLYFCYLFSLFLFVPHPMCEVLFILRIILLPPPPPSRFLPHPPMTTFFARALCPWAHHPALAVCPDSWICGPVAP